MPWRAIGRAVLDVLVAFIAFSAAAACVGAYTSQQTIVNGSVDVNCPFNITLAANSPFYVQPQGIELTYNVVAAGSCYYANSVAANIPKLSGSLTVANSVTHTVYYSKVVSVNGPIDGTPVLGNIIFNSNTPSIPTNISTEYTASLSLSYGENFSSPGTAQFYIFAPANILLDTPSITPATIRQNSQITITQNVVNTGGLAASNMIQYISITGPNGFLFTSNATMSPNTLAPGSEQLILTESSVTPYVGTYTLSDNISYISSYTYNSVAHPSNTLYSNEATTTYTVTSSSSSSSGGGGGGGGSGGVPPPSPPPPPPASISQVEFQQYPIFTGVFQGNSIITIIGVHNAGTAPVWINVTLPSLSFGSLAVSSNSIYLLQNQTQLVYLSLFAGKSAPPGMDVVGLNFSVASKGTRPSYGTVFTEFNILSPAVSSPQVIRTTSITNFTRGMVTQLSVVNPTNKTLYGATLSTLIPAYAVHSIASIQTTGTGSSVQKVSGGYLLSWFLPAISASSSTTLSYSVSNATDIQAFYAIDTVFSVPSAANVSKVKVFDISIPVFYVNQTNNITASWIYTGSNQTGVSFDMVGPPQVGVLTPIYNYVAVPNGAVITKFEIGKIGAPGTYIMQLTVKGGGTNQTFSLPIVVLLTQSQIAAQTQPQLSAASITTTLEYALLALIIIAAFIILFRKGYGRISRPKYSITRAQKLWQMRQRIRRSSGRGIIGQANAPEEQPSSGDQNG